jgi:hypothetical protein
MRALRVVKDEITLETIPDFSEAMQSIFEAKEP